AAGIRNVLLTSPDGLEPFAGNYKRFAQDAERPPDPSAASVELDPIESGADSLALTILALSTLVLLAVCANVINMMYARCSQRTAEIGVRLSLGASGSRIVSLFLWETFLVAAVGTGFGIGLALTGAKLLGAALPFVAAARSTAFVADIDVQWKSIVYALACGGVASLLMGWMMSWRVVRTPP